MKTKFVALGAFAGLYALAAASQASATVVNVTVTGTITQVAQNGGSPLNSVQVGDAFKAVYSFDTTQAGGSTSTLDFTQDTGGSAYSSGPFGHVDAMIGNQSYSFDGSYHGGIGSFFGNLTQVVDSQDGTADAFNEIAISTIEYGIFPADFATPGSYDLSSNDNGLFGGHLATATFSNGVLNITGAVYLQLQHVEVSDGNAVPEPASLSLCAAGLMGAPFFRRRGGKQA